MFGRKQNNDVVNAIDILKEVAKEGIQAGYITSNIETLPFIPELFVLSDAVAMRITYALSEKVKDESLMRTACAWCAYAGIGAVIHWQNDYDSLKTKGVVAALTEERGIDCMDEYVSDIAGFTYGTEKGKALAQHIFESVGAALVAAFRPKQKMTSDAVLEIEKAMYQYGIILEMNALGMR